MKRLFLFKFFVTFGQCSMHVMKSNCTSQSQYTSVDLSRAATKYLSCQHHLSFRPDSLFICFEYYKSQIYIHDLPWGQSRTAENNRPISPWPGNPLVCGCDIAWLLNTSFIGQISPMFTTCEDGRMLALLDPADYAEC